MGFHKTDFAYQKVHGYKWVWGIIAGLITMSYYPLPGIIIFSAGTVMSLILLNSPKNKSARLFNKGLQIYKKGFYDMAIQIWEEAAKKDPENIFPRRALCITYKDYEKNLDLALVHGKKALELDPSNNQIACKVGEILLDIGEFDQAALTLQSIDAQGEPSEERAKLLKKINSRRKS